MTFPWTSDVRPCHGDLARRRQKRGDQGTSRDPPSGLPLFVALLLLTREETITMGMVKSIVIVTGANEASEPVTIIGEALQNLHFKPGQFVPVVEPNPAGGSQRTLVQLHPGFVAGAEEVADKVQDLETATDHLDTRVNNLEVVIDAATPAATAETIVKRNTDGDAAFVQVRASTVRATAESVGVSLQGNNGGKGVEVVYDGTEMKIGFLGGTPGGKFLDLTEDSLQDRFDNLMNFLAQIGLVVQQIP